MIGCEFATVFAAYGVQVTIVELAERILPMEDEDISKTLLREFRKQKIKVLTSARVQQVVPKQIGPALCRWSTRVG